MMQEPFSDNVLQHRFLDKNLPAEILICMVIPSVAEYRSSRIPAPPVVGLNEREVTFARYYCKTST